MSPQGVLFGVLIIIVQYQEMFASIHANFRYIILASKELYNKKTTPTNIVKYQCVGVSPSLIFVLTALPLKNRRHEHFLLYGIIYRC